MNTGIRLEDVSVLFGSRRKAALRLADNGAGREQIRAETGAILGVHGCTLEIAEGEILVLMGLSGSGKSTLLRTINGLSAVTSGRVLLKADDGWREVTAAGRRELREIRTRMVSMVFQHFSLLPWRSVTENVALGLELAGVPAAERRRRVAEQLALVGLADRADSPVSELSGGMQQRVGLARALATRAPILLMDEPFSALDPLIRARLQDELLDLQARLRKTIVFVSHDLEEALRLGHRIAILDGGRIVQCGTAQEILLRPANDHVAAFVSHMNPVSVLRACDIMRSPRPAHRTPRPVAGSVAPETPLRGLLPVLARTGGEIGVFERGMLVGSLDSDDVVAAIARFGASDRNAGRSAR